MEATKCILSPTKQKSFFSDQLPHHLLIKILACKEAGSEVFKYLTGPR